jgi:hypothetical protein
VLLLPLYSTMLLHLLSLSDTRRQWVVPVKSYLKAGEENSLTISIKSAFKTSLANKEAYPYHIPTLYVRAVPCCAVLCYAVKAKANTAVCLQVWQHSKKCSVTMTVCLQQPRHLAALWQQQQAQAHKSATLLACCPLVLSVEHRLHWSVQLCKEACL